MMSPRSLCVLLAALALSIVGLGGCGPSVAGDPPDAGGGTCEGSETRCVGQSFERCVDGQYVQEANCAAPNVCAPAVGCVACDPAKPTTCLGNDVYTCNADGSFGSLVAACGDMVCAGGACGGSGNGCATGSELIYVVDVENRFMSFDPRNDAHTFSTIADLSCPADYDWSGFQPATPFSMSVDRSARAWVLYSSGEIFWVNTNNGQCQPTSFPRGQSGYQLFGMGFVSDAAGSQDEKLFIAGGSYSAPETGKVAYIDPATMAITTIGAWTPADLGPELTGTGTGELYGFFPGQGAKVAKIDKTTGKNLESWPLPPAAGDVAAWAFAHWGGRFYIFRSTTPDFGFTYKSEVLRLDPTSGQVTTVVANSPYLVVGAGVSTCAPVIVE